MDRQNTDPPGDDQDFERLLDAWIHLSPFQKKIIVWRAMLDSIRARAFKYIQDRKGINNHAPRQNDANH